jgi:hypothetical protein
MRKPFLIGLYSPHAQSGKSTAAGILQDHGYQTIKFAGPLKAMALTLLHTIGIDTDEALRRIEGDLKELPVPGLDVTARKLMQTLGTEWGRNAVDNDLWVKVAMEKFDRLHAQGWHVVIDDLRFLNEYQKIRSAGGLLVRINRPSSEPASASPYEGLLSDCEFDIVIENTGSLEDFRAQIEALVN